MFSKRYKYNQLLMTNYNDIYRHSSMSFTIHHFPVIFSIRESCYEHLASKALKAGLCC